jgi:DNA (cytosine-5)-methyltransferase 1
MDRPAHTLDCTAGSWTFEPAANAPARAPEWTEGRPSTTLVGSGRVAAPTARDRDPDWQPGDPWPSHFQNAIRITTEQAAVLMGFRPDYPWKGPRGKQFLQIGNAVCPPIARVVLAEAMRPTLEAEGRRR